MTDDLEPITPRNAVELYLHDRDVADSTLRAHRRRLERFVDWCENEGIDNLNEITGRDTRRFKIDEFDEREDGGTYSKETIRSVMDTLRVFSRYCESIEAVRSGLAEKIQSPNPENARQESLEPDRAEAILAHLRKYEYASHRHVLFRLLWRCGLRLGGVHTLDLRDIDHADNYLEIHHRPETETPLKNEEEGERLVNISSETSSILAEYIQQNRHRVEDDHGREPLLTSSHGRRTKPNLRELVYSVTRPCEYTGDCPHDRRLSECDAAGNISKASQCPSSIYPHAIRRGSITAHLRNEMPKPMVSDRMDVSSDVIDHHYDARSDEERMHQRRDYLPFEDDEDA